MLLSKAVLPLLRDENPSVRMHCATTVEKIWPVGKVPELRQPRGEYPMISLRLARMIHLQRS
jgi:hypothetical protein